MAGRRRARTAAPRCGAASSHEFASALRVAQVRGVEHIVFGRNDAGIAGFGNGPAAPGHAGHLGASSGMGMTSVPLRAFTGRCGQDCACGSAGWESRAVLVMMAAPETGASSSHAGCIGCLSPLRQIPSWPSTGHGVERCACPSGDRHTSPRMPAPVGTGTRFLRGQAPRGAEPVLHTSHLRPARPPVSKRFASGCCSLCRL